MVSLNLQMFHLSGLSGCGASRETAKAVARPGVLFALSSELHINVCVCACVRGPEIEQV